MRKQLCDALTVRSVASNMVFLTGDLGFMALEPLRDAMGARFINAGVAEQNMIGVAAAMAREGLEAWAYSIAPFCYARPFEQIRNDVCLHGLPVKLIGNGGGYAYGVMGPTHHAIEDYGVMLALPHMRAYVPVFDEDLATVVPLVGDAAHPTYLRLGRGEAPPEFDVPAYAPWRQLTHGGGITVLAVGPLAGSYIAAFLAVPREQRPNLWAVAQLPLAHHPLPDAVVERLAAGDALCVVEEHVARGGFGAELALHLLERGLLPKRFAHLYARAHSYDSYGSQTFLRACSGLDPAAVLKECL